MIDEYPKMVYLDDNTFVRLTILGQPDETRLLLFFLTIPEEDRDFIPYDLTDPDALQGWFGGENWAGVFPIAAEIDGKMVGVALLRSFTAPWSAHVGEGWMVTSQMVRGRGIGRVLAHELMTLASELGIEQMLAQVRTENTPALDIFARMGYQTRGNLPGFIKDAEGQAHDVMLLTCHVADYITRVPDADAAAIAEEEARTAGIIVDADLNL